SRSSGSRRKHGGSSSVPNPFRFLGHWGLYWFCVLFIYGSFFSLIGHFIPMVGPWIDTLWVYCVHLLIRLPFWLLAQALGNPWVALALGAFLLWGIHKEFNTGILATILIGGLMVVGWNF